MVFGLVMATDPDLDLKPSKFNWHLAVLNEVKS